MTDDAEPPSSLAQLTAEIVSAYVSSNRIAHPTLLRLITTVASQLAKIGTKLIDTGAVLWAGVPQCGFARMFVRLRQRRLGVTLDVVRSTWTSAGPRQQFVATFGTLGRHSNCHRKLLERARDRLAGLSLAPTERAKAARALCATLRRVGHVIAHQFEVGLAAHAADPRPRLASLHGCSVVPISRTTAKRLIQLYEWLGTSGRARYFFGLEGPSGELLGAVGFGHGAHDASKCGALILERGCCVPHAPRNAASFLIGRALRALRKLGYQRFKAYADPAAGETGAIYAATGFRPVASTRWPWRYALQVGAKVLSDRGIYRYFKGHAAARAAGAEIVKVPARSAWELVFK